MAKNKSSELPHYELMYLISNQFSEDELNPIKERVEKSITDLGGTITNKESMGKKRLAYRIKQFRHGYYELVEFNAPAEAVIKLNDQLRLASDILRHQVVKGAPKTEAEKAKETKLLNELNSTETTPAPAEEAKAKVKAPVVEEIIIATPTPAPVSTPKKEDDAKDKMELKDLDDKLSEILNTDNLL